MNTSHEALTDAARWAQHVRVEAWLLDEVSLGTLDLAWTPTHLEPALFVSPDRGGGTSFSITDERWPGIAPVRRIDRAWQVKATTVSPEEFFAGDPEGWDPTDLDLGAVPLSFSVDTEESQLGEHTWWFGHALARRGSQRLSSQDLQQVQSDASRLALAQLSLFTTREAATLCDYLATRFPDTLGDIRMERRATLPLRQEGVYPDGDYHCMDLRSFVSYDLPFVTVVRVDWLTVSAEQFVQAVAKGDSDEASAYLGRIL